MGGYEREERDGVAQGDGLLIESAVLGADRIIKIRVLIGNKPTVYVTVWIV